MMAQRLLVVVAAVVLLLAGGARGASYLDEALPKYEVSLDADLSLAHPDAQMEEYRVGDELWRCAIPRVEEEEEEEQEREEHEELREGEKQEKHALEPPKKEKKAPASVEEALARLGEAGCLYRLESWWTYEYCWDQELTQFHAELDPRFPKDPSKAVRTASFSLGRKGNAPLVEDKQERYVAQLLSDGTPCDLLSGRKRSAEVRFMCGHTPMFTGFVASVEEPSTCHYLVVVKTPLLCDVPGYAEEPQHGHQIRCAQVE